MRMERILIRPPLFSLSLALPLSFASPFLFAAAAALLIVCLSPPLLPYSLKLLLLDQRSTQQASNSHIPLLKPTIPLSSFLSPRLILLLLISRSRFRSLTRNSIRALHLMPPLGQSGQAASGHLVSVLVFRCLKVEALRHAPWLARETKIHREEERRRTSPGCCCC